MTEILGRQLEVKVYNTPWEGGVQVLLVDHGIGAPGERPRSVVTNMEFTTIDAGDVYPQEPTFRLRHLEAQQLMDSLWDCGLRPTAGKGSAGQLVAVENHLKDMRRLVSKTLEVEL